MARDLSTSDERSPRLVRRRSRSHSRRRNKRLLISFLWTALAVVMALGVIKFIVLFTSPD